MTNKFSPLINNSTPTVHTIRNSIDNNIQGDLPLTKKPPRTTKNFDDIIIFSISKKLLSLFENWFWKRAWVFALKHQDITNSNLMNDIFWFCRNLRFGEFFHEDSATVTNSNNTACNKTQENWICSSNLKIAHSTHLKTRPLQ